MIDKINQLGLRLADLKQGTATIPEVDFAAMERVWPILVTASLTMTEFFYDWLKEQLPAALKEPGVQPLVVFDLEDLEILMGLVEEGKDMFEMLDAWQTGPFAKLELKRWVSDGLGSPNDTHPRQALESWERVTRAMRETRLGGRLAINLNEGSLRW